MLNNSTPLLEADEAYWPALLRRRQIPSLNGIRAIAAIAVVLSHVYPKYFGSAGPLAVACFFVLSGFLITNVLLQEADDTGTISLRNFYIRRTLRIFPAFWVFCGMFGIAALYMRQHVDWLAFTASVLYVGNYYIGLHGTGAGMNHTWSLAVEEQFYLLWPAVFRPFAGRPAKLIPALSAAIGCVWAYRAILQFGLGVRGEYIYCAFETRMDALAIGCLCAVLAHENVFPNWLFKVRWLAPLSAALVVILFISPVPLASLYATPAFAVLILDSIRNHNSPPYRWLNWSPLRRVGLWSYSIYMYHVFVHRIVPPGPELARLPLEILAALALGAASYYVVEKPVLLLRDRIFGSVRRSRPKACAAIAETAISVSDG